MQTPDFNLKSLRTLGIFLTCGALAVGCAGTSVKPMSQDTGPVSSSQVSDASVTASNSKPVIQTPANSATPVSDDTSTPAADSATSVSDDTSTPAADTTTASASKVPEDNTSDTTPKVATAQDSTQPQTTASIQEPSQTTFYYGLNKTTLDDQDKAVLEQHARFLKAHPDLTLEINGHTDSSGSHAYNKFLSKQRAAAVAKILISDGVTSSQLVINALADAKPLANNNDPGKNRRVELQYDDMSMVSTK